MTARCGQARAGVNGAEDASSQSESGYHEVRAHADSGDVVAVR